MSEQKLSPHLLNLQKIFNAELSIHARRILHYQEITVSIFDMSTSKDLKWVLAQIPELTAGDKFCIFIVALVLKIDLDC